MNILNIYKDKSNGPNKDENPNLEVNDYFLMFNNVDMSEVWGNW